MPSAPPRMSDAALTAAVEAAMPIARELFEDVRARTADAAGGVSREPYGAGEQAAVEAITRVARGLDLEIDTDPFGNTYLTLPGRDRNAPGWIVGSHVDSVPKGGNFDGFAGVVAGLAAIAAFRRAGLTPPRDITVMGIRAEELSSWYGGAHDGHIGSRAALGQLPQAELDSAVDSRTGQSLRERMRSAGFDPSAVGKPYLSPSKFGGYLELHIEQGPVLEGRGKPVGVVTAIRGAQRARSCRCIGAYTHSGAVPYEYRSDAVKATVELVREIDLDWDRIRAAGGDLVFTVGKLFTDARLHALTKVPGEVEFTLDFRSHDEAILAAVRALSERLAREIGERRRVRFELGQFSLHHPAAMHAEYRSRLLAGCAALDIP